jgi:hypothetical protein
VSHDGIYDSIANLQSRVFAKKESVEKYVIRLRGYNVHVIMPIIRTWVLNTGPKICDTWGLGGRAHRGYEWRFNEIDTLSHCTM